MRHFEIWTLANSEQKKENLSHMHVHGLSIHDMVKSGTLLSVVLNIKEKVTFSFFS